MSDDEKLSYKILICTGLFILTFWVSGLFHETGHYLIARKLGVPSAQIEWVWIFCIFPAAVKIYDFNFTNMQEFLFNFGGGFTAGVILFILAIVFWGIYKRKENKIFWWIGTFAFAYSVLNFFSCYQETVNHAEYISFKYLPIDVSIIFGLPALMGIFKYRAQIKSLINKYSLKQS